MKQHSRVVIRGCLAAVLAFSPALAGQQAAEPAPGILSHETSVTIRQPRRVTPVPRTFRPRGEKGGQVSPPGRIWMLPNTEGGLSQGGSVGEGAAQRAAPSPVPGPASPPRASSSPPLVQEEAMDVYALSPYARFLALPHMVAPAYATRLRAGLPPPPWHAIIDEAHAIFGLDKALIAAVIRVESNFQADAESPRGAQGAMQLMPGTQADLGLIDPFDPRANVYAGAQYLKQQLDRFGRVDLALAAYNAGPANVEKYGGVPPFAETRDFVRRVMAGL